MTIANGNVANADDILEMSNIRQVYTGSGFDSASSASGIDEQSHELNAQADAPDSNYAVVTITGQVVVDVGNSNEVKLKAQIKETGQSYADIISYKTVILTSENHTALVPYPIVAALTAGMKTNGFQIKVFSRCSGAVAGQRSFTNIQTVQEVRT